jgi:2-keto-4-pentenoate hydratase/2-oxohepta-3-ene-1,7-dioic acid hydratase in catechol pathway
MKLATLKNNIPVVVIDAGYVKLSDLGFDGSLDELVKQGEPIMTLLRSALSQKSFSFVPGAFGAPLRYPSKIVAIGLNYVDHASESKMELPKSPLVFTKFPNSITGPDDKIIIPTNITNRVDYEVELGVIIGKRVKNVSKEDALNYVFGYTVLNDVSARDLQFSDGQWVRGKSLDTFCPIGPIIVTADEIKDVQNLRLSCEVNGETFQEDTTANMIFGVADLISILSKSFTFEPGDIIATGTPSGVGFSRKPPIYLKDGDIVKTTVEGIGQLVNPVVEV